MKVLVIGYGSIGTRHTRLLLDLGCDVSIVSQREIGFEKRFSKLKDALDEVNPSYIVISNKTEEHYSSLMELSKICFGGIVLIEKPVFDKLREIPDDLICSCFVAYNLRFHPIIQELKNILLTEKIISFQVYVGQYLPDWRPDRDYRKSYSAQKKEGGGVLRDLSHELDYLTWILGEWESLNSMGGRFSSLEIDCDDVYAIMGRMERCPIVSVQLNYLDRIGRREIIVNTDQHTVKVDLIKGTIQIDGSVQKFNVERDLTYQRQHQAVLDKKFDSLCSLEEGLKTMQIIESIEKASTT